VTGDDRERDIETAMVEMDVGAADLGVQGPEEGGTWFEVGFGDVADFERLAGTSHDGGEGHDSNIALRAAKQRTSLAADGRQRRLAAG
jgi:hypothetical protein